MSEKKQKKAAPKAAPETKPEEPAQETPAPEETKNEENTASAEPETEAPAEEEKTKAAEDQIKALEEKLRETTDQLMRTLAEYDNFRKRSQKEKDALYADGKADAIAKLLPVADNLERAVAADGDAESYKKGVEMTLKQLTESLSALGVTAFGEPGEAFDPNLHNGVMHEDNEELPENSIAAVFMKGYKMGDKVIRHATVKVAN
jgi:molecular chaperone GrpE